MTKQCFVIFTYNSLYRTFQYVERELPKVPGNIPVLILVSERYFIRNSTIVRTFIRLKHHILYFRPIFWTCKSTELCNVKLLNHMRNILIEEKIQPWHTVESAQWKMVLVSSIFINSSTFHFWIFRFVCKLKKLKNYDDDSYTVILVI